MAKFTPDIDNEMFQLAIQLVNQSNRNIFLTGKAGTGKTTFLKYIRAHCLKQMAIVAPTGVAAINAGGVTIHSFFQLPLSPFIPESQGTGFQTPDQEVTNKHSLISRLRFNTDKKKVLQQLELLVIDEISMVRCDTLDAIDTVLRHIRQRPSERFGGVQVLFIGDLMQLPPVIKEPEWNLLQEYYKGQYFFDSKVLQEEPPVYIEFSKIYRQRDQQFIDLLNQVRNNTVDEKGYQLLESRFNPTFRRTKKDGYIILTTHNNKANDININELVKLEGNIFTYRAEVQDEFSDRAFPADELLQLKEGAQVMFIRNDTADRGKRYYNGKIGTVSRLEEDKIVVQCRTEDQDDEPFDIDVQKEKWENIRYTFNKTTRQLDSDILGSFTQYPLRLAWAITIHKSQGLTFEKAIIDAGEAFAPGQVYVALSRCTNLDGMVLQSRVNPSSLVNDNRIVTFAERTRSGSELQQELAVAKKEYQLSVLCSVFDFSNTINTGKELAGYLEEHAGSFNPEAISWIHTLLKTLETQQETAVKFQQQLQFLFQQPENNNPLQERIKAATVYFTPAIQSIIQQLQQSPAITDSKLYSKEYNDSIKEIFADLALKKHLLEGFVDTFSIDHFHQQKSGFVVPPFYINAYAGVAQQKSDSPHPLLHQQLRKLRDGICAKKDLPVYLVAGTATIDELARYLPQSLTELKKISGFGEVKIRQYGQQFLDLILEYTDEHDLGSLIHEKTTKKEKQPVKDPATKKTDTKALSFSLYKEGKPVQEIAEQRKLTVQTIEGHLAHFIEKGELDAEELVSKERLLAIEPVLNEYKGGPILSIKEKLGNDFGFGEIRLAMAWAKHKKTLSTD